MIMSFKDQNKKRNLFKIIFIQILITLILIVLIDLIANLFIDRVGHKEFRLQRLNHTQMQVISHKIL